MSKRLLYFLIFQIILMFRIQTLSTRVSFKVLHRINNPQYPLPFIRTYSSHNQSKSHSKTRTGIKIMMPVAMLSLGYYIINSNDSFIHTKVEGPLHIRLYASLPLRYISQCWGYINDMTVPMVLRAPLYKTYSYFCGCNLSEMEEEDLTTYGNLGEFFYRKIKSTVRVIDQTHDLVSPSDGKVLHCGEIQHDEIEQVKGVTYSLNALLGILV